VVGVTLEAEEIAAIVPVPEAVVDDASIDLWGEIQDGLAEAVGIALDQAVFSGTNKPATWATAIVPAAIAAGNTNVADSTAAEGGMANDVAATFDPVEADGYDANGIAATRAVRGALRKSRDANGQKLVDVQCGAGLDAPIVTSPVACSPTTRSRWSGTTRSPCWASARTSRTSCSIRR
jgi:HK97 family phage major capsid protein